MRKVSSPTFAKKHWVRAGAVCVLALAVVGGGIQPSYAKSLKDQQDEVRKAMVVAKSNVQDSQKAAQDASTKLTASQAALERAQAKLSQMQSDLRDAKSQQATIDAALVTARAELAKAEAAATKASDDVDRQHKLIGVAARTQYQQNTGLVGFAVALGSESPSDLAQRLQWSTTIFDNTAAQMARLRVLEAQLATAQQQKADAESSVAAQAKAARAQVAKVKKLTDGASAQAASVQVLVANNQKAQKAAQSALALDQKQYQELEKENAKIEAALKKQAAEEKKKAEEAKKKAEEEAKKNGQDVTPTPGANGFIHPVPGAVTSGYGMRMHPILHVWRMHRGVDMHAPCGTPIKAMADGKVLSTTPTARSGGLGNFTIISYGLHGGKIVYSGFAHQSRVIVHAGQAVSQGEVVGYAGTTGLSTGCHLHLQMYEDGTIVNPAKYL